MFPTMSDAGRAQLLEVFNQTALIALGRCSYESMAPFWVAADNPLARPMNTIPKAVFSRTGEVSPPNTLVEVPNADPAALDRWTNPLIFGKDLVADMQKLKSVEGKAIMAIGGASFASSLIAAGLVDQFLLAVHPVALGKGIPLFAGIDSAVHLKLVDSQCFDTGAMLKTYRPAKVAA